MREYVGFIYQHNNKMYVEAIPTFGDIDFVTRGLPPIIRQVIIFAPSRNQARRRMYELTINPMGNGFNKFPLNIHKEK